MENFKQIVPCVASWCLTGVTCTTSCDRFDEHEVYANTRHLVFHLSRDIPYNPYECEKAHIKAGIKFGGCISGWTSATTGYFEFCEGDHHGAIHYVPKKQMWIVIGKWCIGTVEGIAVYEINRGDDAYYPNDSDVFNTSLFNTTARLTTINQQASHVDSKTKPCVKMIVVQDDTPPRRVYVYQGPSNIGKSYITNDLQLRKYETDIEQKIPDDIFAYDVIVIGNKYVGQADEVFQALEKHRNLIVVRVMLSYL